MATEPVKTCVTCWFHEDNYHLDEHYCSYPENIKDVDLVTGKNHYVVASCHELRYSGENQSKCGKEGKWHKFNSVAKAEEVKKQTKGQSTAGVDKTEEWLSKL